MYTIPLYIYAREGGYSEGSECRPLIHLGVGRNLLNEADAAPEAPIDAVRGFQTARIEFHAVRIVRAIRHSRPVVAVRAQTDHLRAIPAACSRQEHTAGITKIEVYEAAVAPAGYTVSLKDGVKDADKWTISPNPAEEGQTVTIQYNGRLKVKSVTATSDAASAANVVDMSTLTGDYEAQNGDVLTGETSSYKVTIAAGATVTLDGVNISSSGYCIKCLGEATIILKDGSTNTLTSTSDAYPALWAGNTGTTLTIQGSTGVLNVTSGQYCAGIGGGYSNTNKTCGNIRIEGGVITAQGGEYGSGIGTDSGLATCGDIIITGGTITAKGGLYAAGIGTGLGDGEPVVCGNITIANTVTKVTATKGEDAAHSIGKGYGGNATCGTIIIGCTLDTNGNPVGGRKYWENNAAVDDYAEVYLRQATIIYPPQDPYHARIYK